jgi:transcription elongation GreA/GreB family factor
MVAINMNSILPHELGMLRKMDASLSDKQAQLAKEQSEAVGTSDWHDNDAYDAVVQERNRVDYQREAVAMLVNGGARVIDYPERGKPEVTLGSLIIGQDKFGEAPFVVVGQLYAGTDEYANAWQQHNQQANLDELVVITGNSPLGKAALGTTAGSDLTYQLENGAEHSLHISQVDQDWVRDNFQTSA